MNYQRYTEKLQWHHGIEHFDYNPAVDWAIELIRNGYESENILIVASFGKPVDREEIKPYIFGALQELGLSEKYGSYSIIANAHYHLEQILHNHQIRKHLRALYQLCLSNDYEKGLVPFYLLHHAWQELEEMGENYYYPGVDLNNMEEAIKKEAQLWIDQYIHGKVVEKEPKASDKKSVWKSIKDFWKMK